MFLSREDDLVEMAIELAQQLSLSEMGPFAQAQREVSA